MRCPSLAACVAACLLAGLAGGAGAAEEQTRVDETVVGQSGIATDGPALLEFFRKRCSSSADEARMKTLVRQLGDDEYEVREKATQQLAALGPLAVPLLRQALHESDIEVVRRAEACLREIETGHSAAVVGAAARLVGVRKPDGAVAVLLDYLPFADDDSVAEEVRGALTVLALHDGRPDPLLIAALSDKRPARRGGAAVALWRAGAEDQKPAIRKLLDDPEASVRLRVGLALAEGRQREAFPVLIALLDQLPPSQTWEIEEVLYRVAEGKTPVLTGTGDAARREFRQAWAKWWTEHGAATDLARVAPPKPLGYTMVILLDKGKLLELDQAKKVRWEIDGLQFPLDAQYLPNDHVLVAEQGGNLVTERTLKGEVVWKKEIIEPVAAQRLPNGNTFIACRNQLAEVDAKGNEVFTHRMRPNELVMRAQRQLNGEIALVTSSNTTGETQFARLDAEGRPLFTFPVQIATFGGRIEALPGGRVLIPEMNLNRVVEYDNQGKIIWEASVEQPIVATRLPNGHTLVTSMTQQRAVELDRQGKEVWEYRQDTRVTRAWRR